MAHIEQTGKTTRDLNNLKTILMCENISIIYTHNGHKTPVKDDNDARTVTILTRRSCNNSVANSNSFKSID